MEQLVKLAKAASINDDHVVNALLLTDVCIIPNTLDIDVNAVERAVAGWTLQQKEEALCWAWTEHLEANDNEVTRIECPQHVAVLRK